MTNCLINIVSRGAETPTNSNCERTQPAMNYNIYLRNLSKFYVYAYIRNKDSKTAKAGTPYYIGKGSKLRLFEKHNTFIPKNKKYIIIISDNLNEDDAFKLEILSIKLYRRKDLGTGILHNKTNGGEGTSGAILPPRSNEAIQKHKISLNQFYKLHPEYSHSQSILQKEAQNRPHVKEQRNKRNSNLEFKEFHRQAIIQGIKNSDYKNETRSKIQSKIWNNSDIREKHKQILNNPDVKIKHQEGLKKYWENENNRTHRSIIQQNSRKIKIKCEYCNIEIDRQNYAKSHGNNCKKNLK